MKRAWMMAVALLVGCGGDGGGQSVAESLCSDPNVATVDTSEPTDATGGDCTMRKVDLDPCIHRGVFTAVGWRHAWAADTYGNTLWPDSGPHTAGAREDRGYGCDAELRGVSFDGYKVDGDGSKVVFEMKTTNWTGIQYGTCPDVIKQQILDRTWENVVGSVKKEEPVAAACGLAYVLVLTDATLAERARGYFQAPHTVTVDVCDECREPPPMPAGYTREGYAR